MTAVAHLDAPADGIHVATYIAPSHWASALVNDDWSGLEDDDALACRAWAASLPGPVVSCEPEGFCSWHDAWDQHPYKGDCQRYFVHVRRNV